MDVEELVGRRAETALIDDLLAALPSSGGAVVVSGEPGIGKSALLHRTRVVAGERGFTVLSAVATPSEARLPFAGLHQLLHPLLQRASVLPPTLRTALEVALGVADGDEPEVFRVALATLHLVTGVAEEAPIVVVVDDAHWFDAPSLEVLGFLSRRIDADPVAVVAAHRSGTELPLTAVARTRLRRLDHDDAVRLLQARRPGLDERLRSRVLQDAEGNPLALVELPDVLRGRPDLRVPGEIVPLTERLERSYAGRFTELPRPTRTLLLVAAINEGDSVAEGLDAAGPEAGLDDLTPAAAHDLARTDGVRVWFTHPLIRSAVIQRASPEERLAAHAALARALADHPHRAVWHRAALAAEPDEDIADALDAAAALARAYGATALAGAALERACELSEDPARRGDRLLRAAEIAFELGRTESMLQMLDDVEELAIPTLEGTRLLLVQEWFDEEEDWSSPERARAFVDTAQRIHDTGRADLAVRSLNPLAVRCFCNDYPDDLRGMIAAAAERLGESTQHPDVLFVLAGCRRNEGYRFMRHGLQLATSRPGADADLLKAAATAATMVGDFATAARVLPIAAAQLRAQGRLGLLAQALTSLSYAHILCGDLLEAGLVADEAARLCHETSQLWWKTGATAAQAVLLGLQGRRADSEALIARAEAETPVHSSSPLMWAEVQVARGLTALAAGDAGAALDELLHLFDPGDRAYGPSTRWWGVTELVEAAHGAGRLDEVRAIVGELTDEAARTGSPVQVTAAVFVAPLVADDPGPAYAAAVADGFGGNLHLLGRTHLSYGSWLVEQQRVAEAREQLRAAVAAFDRIGATAWRDTALARLADAGEQPPALRPPRDLLDAEELRIARMVAAGMGDRAIAEELYLSVRAVGGRVARILRTLGVAARGEIGGAL